MGRIGSTTSVIVGILLVYLSAWEAAVQAIDPELITDFAVPAGVNASLVDGNYFTYTGFRGGVSTKPGQVAMKKATVEEYPALYGLGLSYTLMYFQPGGVLAPHLHPRGSKLIYVIQGELQVGFIDTSYKLYNQTLYEGDLYVIPKALVHYMANLYSKTETKVIFSFSSSNPGILELPTGLFASVPGIPSEILEKSFGVTTQTLEALEYGVRSVAQTQTQTQQPQTEFQLQNP